MSGWFACNLARSAKQFRLPGSWFRGKRQEGAAMAEVQSTADAASCCTEFFSAHVESLREALSTVDANDREAKVEAEIEASKAHWSELRSAHVTVGEAGAVESASTSESESSRLESERTSEVESVQEEKERMAEDNVEVFRNLQARCPGGFFVDDNDVGPDHLQKLPPWMFDEDGELGDAEYKLSSEKPFAEGGQAQLFYAHALYRDGEKGEMLVMKVFKEGTSLRGLQRLLPPSMLDDEGMQDEGRFGVVGCNIILGARLLKADGRFAFLMGRAWGDLRKLMDTRMLLDNNQGAPFSDDIAAWCMLCVAEGMQCLHDKDIVHRDLKAANVLVLDDTHESDDSKWWADLDPFNLKVGEFGCLVADYECSVGVVGTRFWRAPEILLALKNRNHHEKPEIFSKQADVYSFGMTCYEILSGRIPLEELKGNDYDAVIGGARPILPKETPPWMVDMVKRCWHHDPSMRPMFDEIVKLIEKNRVVDIWSSRSK